MTPSLAPSAVLERVERDVERAIRRGRNGLRYAAGTRRPKVGQTPKDVVWRRHQAELLGCTPRGPHRWVGSLNRNEACPLFTKRTQFARSGMVLAL